MRNIHKVATALTVIGAVGITYALLLIKGIPEDFSWEDNEDF
jgi:hypothetical protein